MLDELQIRRTWEGIVAAETRADYFGRLMSRYQTRLTVLSWCILLFASADAATVFADLGAGLLWVRHLISLFLSGMSVYLVVAKLETKSVRCADLRDRWSRLQREYEELWRTTYLDSASGRLEQLEEASKDYSDRAAELPNDERLMRRSETFALGHVMARFA